MKILNNFCKASCVGAVMLSIPAAVSAANYAWPENFEGVMLQGFFWDSYAGANNSKWSTLTQQADELSANFKLIWVPNSAKAASNPSMGYDPVYWFSNYNSSFGTEAQLRTMISTFKEKGTGIIADVVINHRSGVSNWTNFPAETWRGKTYALGPEHICCTDEVKDAAGQAKPTGAYDTGEDFNGSRDLDHTSSVVQENCKAYCTFLLEDLGYAGFRYDMVKGYAPRYTKIYNEASKPTYSVGEYWDGQYDAVAAWIEGTGKQSAAFDFPGKYAINEAFATGDMTKLCWMANGVNPQPAGMIHFGYAQYAVTFVDNHDTYRDGSKFTGNVMAANAFILCSPGTPCIFLPHWQEYKAQLKPIIAARNACGVTNTSKVTVFRHERNCYMAEIIGSRGRMAVKIGGTMDSTAGYDAGQIVASGQDYCVWSTAGSGGDVEDPKPEIPADGTYTVYFDNSNTKWQSVYTWIWDNTANYSGGSWPGAKMTLDSNTGYYKYSFSCDNGGAGLMCIFNPGGDDGKTADLTLVNNGIYNQSGFTGQTVMATGVETAVADSDNVSRYFTIMGIPVDRPEPGQLYIVVKGDRVTKEIYR